MSRPHLVLLINELDDTNKSNVIFFIRLHNHIDNQTRQHRTLYAVPFSESRQLRNYITQNPDTSTILYTLGSNDTDTPYITTDPNYTERIIKAILAIAKDTYEFGVLPFFVDILPRTKFHSAQAIIPHKSARENINRTLKHTLHTQLGYDALVETSDLAHLSDDGVHLTTESYMKILQKANTMIQTTLTHRHDQNNNIEEPQVVEEPHDSDTEMAEDNLDLHISESDFTDSEGDDTQEGGQGNSTSGGGKETSVS